MECQGRKNYAVVWKIGDTYYRRTYVSREIAETWYKNRKSLGVDTWCGTMGDYKRLWKKLELADLFDEACDRYFLHPTKIEPVPNWLDWQKNNGGV